MTMSAHRQVFYPLHESAFRSAIAGHERKARHNVHHAKEHGRLFGQEAPLDKDRGVKHGGNVRKRLGRRGAHGNIIPH